MADHGSETAEVGGRWMRVFGTGRSNGPGRRARLKECCLAAVALSCLGSGVAAAQETAAGAASATFFTAPGFSGSPKTLTLAPDAPFQAIPFVGDELNGKIASMRVDAGLGVVFFQRPYFASRDDVCGPNLGTRENPQAWWLGRTADFEPPRAVAGDQPYEAAEMQDDDYSSLIAFRRDLGPPPGFLLLERRSYYNRACERSDEQSYFNRLFVPVPNPPQRQACIDLAQAANSHGAGADAPRFVRLSEAVALFPENFNPRYQGADHRFTATIFAGPGCSGASITLTSQQDGRPARHKLKDYDFDRRAQSVLIRYQRGPLDPYLEAPEVASAAPATAASGGLAPSSPAASIQASPAPSPGSQPAAPASGGGLQPAPPQAAQTPAAPAQAAPRQAQQPLAQPPLAQPPGSGLQPAPPGAPSQAPQQAPQQPPQQALQPVPQPQVQPAPAVPPAPRTPTTAPEETFRFPVHQVYRLNFCVDGDRGCGDPAANAWCQDKGFSSAARWAREENIGALYPTVFIGSGAICDKFLCDGFEEITCQR